MEKKRVIDTGTGTISVYYGDLGNPYVEIREGYHGESLGLYLEYDECLDELIGALNQVKEQKLKMQKTQPV